MIVNRSHKIELQPTAEQVVQLKKSCGVARYAYNWGLEEYKKSLDSMKEAKKLDPSIKSGTEKVSDLKKRWNASKPKWCYESPKDANQQPFTHLQKALSNFFRDLKKPKGSRKSGFPKYKKRGEGDSFYCSNDKIQIPLGAHKVRLPLIGWIATAEQFKPLDKKNLHINSAVVSRQADHWYVAVSYSCEVPDPVSDFSKPVACIDLGMRTFATILDSEGLFQEIEAPRPLAKALARLRHKQRMMARSAGAPVRKKNKRHSAKHKKVSKAVKRGIKLSKEERLKRRLAKKEALQNPGAAVLYVAPEHKNYEKLKTSVSRLHRKVACIRKDFLDKLSTRLLRENQAIVIEDLNITGWAANRRWSRKVGDLGFRTFRTMLEYKAPLYGTRIEVLDRWYPSSKTCSHCGHIHSSLKHEKLWTCPECFTEHDRDINAVSNMMQDTGYKLLVTEASLGCGLLTVSPCSSERKCLAERSPLGEPAEGQTCSDTGSSATYTRTKQAKSSRGRRPSKLSAHLCAPCL